MSALDGMQVTPLHRLLVPLAFPGLDPDSRAAASALAEAWDEVLHEVLSWARRGSAGGRTSTLALPATTDGIVGWAGTRHLHRLVRRAREATGEADVEVPDTLDGPGDAGRSASELRLLGRLFRAASSADRLLLLSIADPSVAISLRCVTDELGMLTPVFQESRLIALEAELEALACAGFAAADLTTFALEAATDQTTSQAPTFETLLVAIASACGREAMTEMGRGAAAEHRSATVLGLTASTDGLSRSERLRLLAAPSASGIAADVQAAAAAILRGNRRPAVVLDMCRAILAFSAQSAGAYAQNLQRFWADTELQTDRIMRGILPPLGPGRA